MTKAAEQFSQAKFAWQLQEAFWGQNNFEVVYEFIYLQLLLYEPHQLEKKNMLEKFGHFYFNFFSPLIYDLNQQPQHKRF